MTAGEQKVLESRGASLMRRDPALFSALVAIWLSLAVFVLYPALRLFLTAFVADGRLSFSNLAEVLEGWYFRGRSSTALAGDCGRGRDLSGVPVRIRCDADIHAHWMKWFWGVTTPYLPTVHGQQRSPCRWARTACC